MEILSEAHSSNRIYRAYSSGDNTVITPDSALQLLTQRVHSKRIFSPRTSAPPMTSPHLSKRRLHFYPAAQAADVGVLLSFVSVTSCI